MNYDNDPRDDPEFMASLADQKTAVAKASAAYAALFPKSKCCCGVGGVSQWKVEFAAHAKRHQGAAHYCDNVGAVSVRSPSLRRTVWVCPPCRDALLSVGWTRKDRAA